MRRSAYMDEGADRGGGGEGRPAALGPSRPGALAPGRHGPRAPLPTGAIPLIRIF